MSESLKKLRVFAASPSDVTNERAKLETVVESLKPMADYLGLTLEVVDWRAVVPDAGRPQQIIFDQLKPTSWDIFIGILWHRFGTPPGAKDKTGKDYLSGTEEEFKTAYELWKQHGKPRMVLYRCTRALPFDVDPDQLKNVRAFFKLIEDVKGDYPTLYQAFDTTESFEKLVLNNLQKLLVEYGKESKTPITPEVVQILAPKIPNNLPRRQAFFGRTKEMDVVMRALSPVDRTWGVLVDGIGGIGKSAIAIEAAYLSQEKNSFDAFVFVTAKTNILEPSGIKELNPPARTLDEFLNETARVLGQSGVAKLTGDEKRTTLIDVLRSSRTLLIYDNLETLSKEEQEGIADFLRELPQGCKAIITSRRRGGEGAVWLRVEKLDWEAAHGIIENEMKRDAGMASKLNYVGEARWQELFDETNGSPLALVHTLGLMRVRAALTFNGVLEILRGNHDEDLQKFIFQEASKELTENDKGALSALSFFVPSSTFEAWMVASELSRSTLETTIDRLSALSLVDLQAEHERYTLHPLTRVFIRNELLADEKVAREMGMRYALYWAVYSKRYGSGKEGYKTYHMLDLEWANIEEAVNWLWDISDVKEEDVGHEETALVLIEFISLLSGYLEMVGRWDEALLFTVRGYSVAIALKNWARAGNFASIVSWIQSNRNNVEDSESWTEKCANAWSHNGGTREQARIMVRKGWNALNRQDYQAAEKLWQKALEIWKSLGADIPMASSLNDLGWLEGKRGNYQTSERYLEQGLKIAIRKGDKESEAVIYDSFGLIALDQNDYIKARVWFEKLLPLAREVGRLDAVGQAQYGFARVLEAEGDLEKALLFAKDALVIYQKLHDQYLADTPHLVERLKNKIMKNHLNNNG